MTAVLTEVSEFDAREPETGKLESAPELRCGESLEELLAGLPADPFAVRVVEGVPQGQCIFEAARRCLRLACKRIESAAEEIAEPDWEFDWADDDPALGQQTAFAELIACEKLLDELRAGLATWFRFVNAGRVVELSDDALARVSRIAASLPLGDSPYWCGPAVIAAGLILLEDAEPSERLRAIARIKWQRRKQVCRGSSESAAALRKCPLGEPDGAPWPQDPPDTT